MEKLFNGNTNKGGDANMQTFNDDISRWDTSNVTTMYGMFWVAHAFNRDLSRWDTSNVTDMYGMFCYAYAFNGDLSRWNTSNVTRMNSMFNGFPIETEHKPPRCRYECNKGGNDKQGQKKERVFQNCIFNLAFSFYNLALTYHKFVH